MKLKRLSFFLLAIGLVYFYLNNETSWMLSKTTIHVNQKYLKTGRVNAGDSLEFNFYITNTGNAPLTITNVEPDCHCLSTYYKNKAINSGDSIKIRIVYVNPLDGWFRKSALVFGNFENSPVELVAEGIVDKVYN